MASLHDKIDEVIARFDFEQVHKVMTFLKWEWAYTVAGGRGVPTIGELKSTAQHLLFLAVDDYEKNGKPPTGAYVSTGGFSASVDVYRDGHDQVRLLFYVNEVSAGAE